MSVVAVYDVKPNVAQYLRQVKYGPESRGKAPHAVDSNTLSLGVRRQGRAPHRDQFRNMTSGSQTSNY
jgi:hypothetical protein